jgi:hypothetical protein
MLGATSSSLKRIFSENLIQFRLNNRRIEFSGPEQLNQLSK